MAQKTTSAMSAAIDQVIRHMAEDTLRQVDPLSRVHPAARIYYTWGFGGAYPKPFNEQVMSMIAISPLAHERFKTWLKRKAHEYRPVLMTQRQREELEYYD